MKAQSLLRWFAVLFFLFAPVAMKAQSKQVDGTITDGGKPVAGAAITLTDKASGRALTGKTDINGKFSMAGVPAGEYNLEIASTAGQKFEGSVAVAASAAQVTNLKVDIAEARPPAAAGPGQTSSQTAGQSAGQTAPPTQGATPTYTKEQLDEIKRQNEIATQMNALIRQVNAALTAKHWQEAIPLLRQLLVLAPDNWQLWSGLGDAQLNLGENDHAIESYKKGIEAAQRSTKVDPNDSSTDPTVKKTGVAKMLTNQGNAYLKLKKNKEAIDAYTRAAAIDPNPAVAYFNLCATQYNTGNTEGALQACDKAIAGDPKRADAYFIKGSLLIADSTTDKDGRIVVPPGTVETLKKYLELTPNGAHAEDVKQMLTYAGSRVETQYQKK